MQTISAVVTPNQNWTALQKNAFRFFFIFLSLTSLLAYNIFFIVMDTFFTESHYTETHKLFSVLSKPVHWIDVHFFHVGYNPVTDTPFFGDGRFGWVLLPIVFSLSVIATVVWAIADRKRVNYNKLHYWFRTYLCFYIFIAMISYAVQKMIPTQMPYPNIASLLTPFGQKNKMALVWDFVGISPSYSFFTGLCELTGSLLLLCRRTRVFGALFMLTVLLNVVTLNVFYNIGVKLNCMLLLLINLFLLVPYIPKLFRFFYYLQPVSLAEKQYTFSSPWKKYAIIALMLVPAWMSFKTITRVVDMNAKNIFNRKQQRLYEVSSFIKGNDTLPPLLTDTLRWKRLAITDYQGRRFAIIYKMKDERDGYAYQVDSTKKIITFTDNPDSTRKFYFSYTEPAKNKLLLKGKWNGETVQVLLDNIDIDNLPVVKEKFTWVRKI